MTPGACARAAAAIVATLWSASSSAAVGTSSTADLFEAREDAMFGDADERDDAVFGERDDAVFGERDDAVFGERDDAVFGETATVAPSRDTRVLGGERGVLDRLAAAAEAADDYLDIGGELWLWAQWDALREGAPKNFPLRSPSFFDLYLDARPTPRVRGFIKLRTSYDFTVGSDDVDLEGQPLTNTAVALDQMWLKFDVARELFVTFGKERQRWGSGRIWNPTDFLNPAAIDPFAFLDLRLGVPLLKLHYPVESLGWNFYAIALLDGANRLDDVGGAFRAEFLVLQTELAFSTAVQKGRPLRVGIDVTSGVWLFDLKAELALRYGEDAAFYRGRLLLNPRDLTDPLELPEAYDRSDEWIPQLVLGAEIQIPYSDRDNVTFVLEYFYNDVSFEDSSLYLVPLAAGFGLPGFEDGSAVRFNPLFFGRHYAALSVVLFGPGDWDDTTFVFAGVANLSDRSATLNLNYSVRLFSYLQLNAFARTFVGPAGRSFTLELDIPPIPGQFAGFRQPPGLFTIGTSLTLAL